MLCVNPVITRLNVIFSVLSEHKACSADYAHYTHTQTHTHTHTHTKNIKNAQTSTHAKQEKKR